MATILKEDKKLNDLEWKINNAADGLLRIIKEARASRNEWKAATNASRMEKVLNELEKALNSRYSR